MHYIHYYRELNETALTLCDVTLALIGHDGAPTPDYWRTCRDNEVPIRVDLFPCKATAIEADEAFGLRDRTMQHLMIVALDGSFHWSRNGMVRKPISNGSLRKWPQLAGFLWDEFAPENDKGNTDKKAEFAEGLVAGLQLNRRENRAPGKRPRGRPPKLREGPTPVKRPRGRPPKLRNGPVPLAQQGVVKRRPGRPPKQRERTVSPPSSSLSDDESEAGNPEDDVDPDASFPVDRHAAVSKAPTRKQPSRAARAKSYPEWENSEGSDYDAGEEEDAEEEDVLQADQTGGDEDIDMNHDGAPEDDDAEMEDAQQAGHDGDVAMGDDDVPEFAMEAPASPVPGPAPVTLRNLTARERRRQRRLALKAMEEDAPPTGQNDGEEDVDMSDDGTSGLVAAAPAPPVPGRSSGTSRNPTAKERRRQRRLALKAMQEATQQADQDDGEEVVAMGDDGTSGLVAAAPAPPVPGRSSGTSRNPTAKERRRQKRLALKAMEEDAPPTDQDDGEEVVAMGDDGTSGLMAAAPASPVPDGSLVTLRGKKRRRSERLRRQAGPQDTAVEDAVSGGEAADIGTAMVAQSDAGDDTLFVLEEGEPWDGDEEKKVPLPSAALDGSAKKKRRQTDITPKIFAACRRVMPGKAGPNDLKTFQAFVEKQRTGCEWTDLSKYGPRKVLSQRRIRLVKNGWWRGLEDVFVNYGLLYDDERLPESEIQRILQRPRKTQACPVLGDVTANRVNVKGGAKRRDLKPSGHRVSRRASLRAGLRSSINSED